VILLRRLSASTRMPIALRPFARVAALAALIGLGGSCADGTAPSVEPCAYDQEEVVHVSAGTRPAFTWSPACGMTSVLLFPAAEPAAVWVVYGGGRGASPPGRLKPRRRQFFTWGSNTNCCSSAGSAIRWGATRNSAPTPGSHRDPCTAPPGPYMQPTRRSLLSSARALTPMAISGA
jgi:hypothetical protein